MKQTVVIQVNGEQMSVPANGTLQELMDHLGVPRTGTAVEVEGQIVTSAQFGKTLLREGLAIEIVRMVGGG
jgi:sulfur carrier protein